MTEENLPELYKSQSRTEKLPTKKEFERFAKEFLEINPQMEPEEVVKRVKRYLNGPNPNLSPEKRNKELQAQKLRNEKLLRDGYDPDEWTYFGIASQPKKGWNTPFTEEDLRLERANLPEEVELLIVQGHIASASDHDRENRGIEFYRMDHFWEKFIRIRPKGLSQ